MRIVMSGCGVVGRAFLRLLDENRESLYARHGFAPRIVGVVDSRGAALAEQGLDIAEILHVKDERGTVAELSRYGYTGLDGSRAIRECDANVLVEATPSSLAAPHAAIERLKIAFGRGMHAVSVNKVPLAVALPGLRELAEYNDVLFHFSGTVGAGTPVLALAQQCSLGDEILKVQAILNGTTNFILWRMHEQGESFDDALAEAIKLGYAEADPSGDIDGLDTAMKLVIFANVVLGRSATLDELKIEGIRGMSRERIAAATEAGNRVKLVGEIGDKISVAPMEVDAHGPLDVPANLNVLNLSLRHAGGVSLAGRGAGGVETATAVLRDLLDIWHTIGSRS